MTTVRRPTTPTLAYDAAQAKTSPGMKETAPTAAGSKATAMTASRPTAHTPSRAPFGAQFGTQSLPGVPPAMDPTRWARGFANANLATLQLFAQGPAEAWKAPMVYPFAFTIGFSPEVLIGAALGR